MKKIEMKAVYSNLKNWDFDGLGHYRMTAEEAETVRESFERMQVLEQKQINLHRIKGNGKTCNSCGNQDLLAIDSNGRYCICPECGGLIGFEGMLRYQ